jgi:hypothetical protein
MKILNIALISMLGLMGLPAQDPFCIDITGTPQNHVLSFPTQQNFNYQIFMSLDLQSFMDTGIVEPGSGNLTQYGIMSDARSSFIV